MPRRPDPARSEPGIDLFRMDDPQTLLTVTGALYGAGVFFFAYLIRGIAGFGSALIAVPLLTMQWPLAMAVPVVGLLDYIASISHGLQGRRLIRWPDLLPLLPFSFIGVQAGLYFLKRLPTAELAVALAIFILLFAVYSLLPLPQIKGSRRWAAVAGFMGGMVGALFGTGGPFYVIYLSMRGLDKSEFRATAATIFMFDGGFRILSYLFGGIYDRYTMAGVALGLPVLAVGMAVGGRIHLALSREHFVRLISLILMGSAVALLIRYGGF